MLCLYQYLLVKSNALFVVDTAAVLHDTPLMAHDRITEVKFSSVLLASAGIYYLRYENCMSEERSCLRVRRVEMWKTKKYESYVILIRYICGFAMVTKVKSTKLSSLSLNMGSFVYVNFGSVSYPD